MNRQLRTITIFLSLLMSALAAHAGNVKFQAAPGPEPVVGRYLVMLDASVAIDLAGASAEALARAYGGQLEPFASEDARQFAITMLPARARTLSADPRVREVTEIAQPEPLLAPSPSNTAAKLTGHLTPVPRDVSSSGTYLYDGSGNIKSIGSDSFLYDVEGRLMQATVQGSQQSYTYDAFGNRTSATRAQGSAACAGGCEAVVTVNHQNNHLAEQTYDEAGNVKSGYGATYTYDGTGMVTRATVGSDDRIFLYTADDERIAVRQGASWTWTVRDQGNKVLREFTSLETSFSPLVLSSHTWSKDYVWRDGQLLASVFQSASGPTTYHYHLDHLGTPRMITGNGGVLVAKHTYYPFGAEMDLTPHENAVEAMKFTGHERDIVAASNGSVDYLHARYYNGNLARFVAVDPSLKTESASKAPQLWNRYQYSTNNPINAIDPDGKDTFLVNRTIGGSVPAGALVSLRAQIVSHTFIMTTSRGQIHTYSWGNTADGATVGRWFKDSKEDHTAAVEAYSVKDALRWAVASHEGDSSLDPYIEKAFQMHANRSNDRSNHMNFGIWGNCKTEALELIKEAERLKAEDDKKKTAAPTIKPTPDDKHSDGHS